MKVTDEKWRIEPRLDDEFSTMRMIHNDEGKHIVNALGIDRAHLAVAAPDLYRALEFALECWFIEVGDKSKEDYPRWVIGAQEAITKARGEV